MTASLQAMSKEADALSSLLLAGKALDEDAVSKLKKALSDLTSAQRQVNAAKQVSQTMGPDISSFELLFKYRTLGAAEHD